MHRLRRRNLQKRDGQCGVYELSRWDVLGNGRGKQRDRLYELPRWDVFTGGDERVYHLFSRDVFTGGDERLHGLSDQHVFRCVCVGLPGVPGERDVGGGECLAGILLLPERVCACGGLVHVPAV